MAAVPIRQEAQDTQIAQPVTPEIQNEPIAIVANKDKDQVVDSAVIQITPQNKKDFLNYIKLLV